MIDLNNITIEKLQKACETWNYSFFTKGDYNLNIIGIRNKTRVPNKFDDKMCLVYKENGNWILKVYDCTTDPGTYYLLNPMSKDKGTAIIVPSQYRGVYQLGLHKGQYKALVQTGGVIAVYRDNNKDNLLDHDARTIEVGYFGTNIHRSNPKGESYEVNNWSAGCQVLAKVKDFNELISICEKSEKIYGNKFTYTLFDQRQIE